jgi:hypothetical protein
LNHDDIPNPFGVILKELLEGTELILKIRIIEIKSSEETNLLNDAFHDVELITANDDFLPFIKIPESLEFGFYPGTSATGRIPSGIGVIISRKSETTNMSRATLSASIPTGQCMTAVTWPSTSIPRVVVSYPHTLIQVEMKCREYEYVYLGNQFRILKIGKKSTNLETHEIRTKHAIEDFLSA